MATSREPIGELILKQLFDTEEMLSQNPTVLSCGGIYIPRSKPEQNILYQIITTSSNEEPVKVVTGARPRNALYDALLKESMN